MPNIPPLSQNPTHNTRLSQTHPTTRINQQTPRSRHPRGGSFSCGTRLLTGVWTKYADESKTRHWNIEAAKATPYTASETHAQRRRTPRPKGAPTGRCWVYAAGDPDGDVTGAWLAKESARDVYLTDNPDDARLLLDKAITGCRDDWVQETRSLGRTPTKWQTEIPNHHRTGASNSPTERLNLSIKKIKRCGHGFRNFDNYRLRVLPHTGGINWPATRPPPPRIRTRSPHSDT